jgi:hypothetical protein
MCFSIIFTNRTLDFSAMDDEVLKNWFLGLQGCICKDKDEVYSTSKFTLKKAFMKIDFHCKSKNITREELLMNAIATTVAQQSANANRGRELELMMTPRVRQVVAANQQESEDKVRRELLCKGAVLIKHAYNDSRLREPKWFQVCPFSASLSASD